MNIVIEVCVTQHRTLLRTLVSNTLNLNKIVINPLSLIPHKIIFII